MVGERALTGWARRVDAVTGIVDCDGAAHRVRWHRGQLVLCDHDVVAERALVAVGGTPPLCLEVLDLAAEGFDPWATWRSWADGAAWDSGADPTPSSGRPKMPTDPTASALPAGPLRLAAGPARDASPWSGVAPARHLHLARRAPWAATVLERCEPRLAARLAYGAIVASARRGGLAAAAAWMAVRMGGEDVPGVAQPAALPCNALWERVAGPQLAAVLEPLGWAALPRRWRPAGPAGPPGARLVTASSSTDPRGRGETRIVVTVPSRWFVDIGATGSVVRDGAFVLARLGPGTVLAARPEGGSLSLVELAG